MRSLVWYLMLIIYTFNVRHVNAQAIHGYNYSYYNFSKSDGIPEVNVYAIAQDHRGFMYAGAGSGLYIHNGTQWASLASPIDNENNNIATTLSHMIFDSIHQLLYVASQTDIQCYDPESGTFSRVTTDEGFHDEIKLSFFTHHSLGTMMTTSKGIYQIVDRQLKPLMQSKKWPLDVQTNCVGMSIIDNDLLAICTKEQMGVYSISKNKMDLYPHPIGSYISKGIYDRHRNRIWFQSLKFLYFFDINTKKYGYLPSSSFTDECRDIILKDENQLWINSGQFFDLKKNKWQVIPYNEGKYTNAIQYWPRLFIDKENNLWTGSHGYNLNVLYDKNKYVRNIPFTHHSLNLEPISSIYAHQKIYATNSSNGNLLEYSIPDNMIRLYNIPETPSLLNLCYDNKNTLYLTSDNRIFKHDIITHRSASLALSSEYRSKIPYIEYLSYFENQLCYGDNKGCIIYDLETNESSYLPLELYNIGYFCSKYYDDIDRRLYLVFSKEIIVYDIRSKKLTKLWVDKQSLHIKNQWQVVRIGEHLWITSLSDGLYRYHLGKRTIKVYNKDNALMASNFLSLLSKDGSNLWIGSVEALFLFDTKKEHIIAKLDRQIGFKHDAASYGLTTDQDYVIKFTYGNIDVLDKKALSPVHQVPLYIFTCDIDGKESFGRPMPRDTTIIITENESIIDLSYGIPHFTNYNYNHFQYRILGIDTTWRPTFSTTMRLPKLSTGTYTVEIRAWMSNGQQVDDQRKLTIKIKPLFYKRWWFVLLAVSSLIGMLYALYRLKIDRIKTELILKNKYEKQISDLEMKALRAQMNPHFVFNSLNSIENYILKNDRVMASEYLGKFSKLIRNILDNSRTEVIPLTREIETLKLYIELEVIRNERNFSVLYNIDPTLLDDNIHIPPMLMQPHVENAIIHGLKYLEDKSGVLKVTLRNINDEYIAYSIEDNGIGRQKSIEIKSANAFNHKSYGMDITQNRIELHNQKFKTSISFTIDDIVKDGKASGTIVQFFIPFQ